MPAAVDSSGLRDGRSRPGQVGTKSGAESPTRSELRKARRHARREQLYVAVREAMTHAGVLAASYKFKVLSLDQRGDQFLVMTDVASALAHQPDRLAAIEGQIVEMARARYEIVVTAVYWRSESGAAMARPQSVPPAIPEVLPSPSPVAASAPVAPGALAAPPVDNRHLPLEMPQKKAGSRYDPIQDDEVAAFKQALATASIAPGVPDAHGKVRTGLHSYTLLTGFEDTEMPENPASPALSATQYGDLN